MAPQLTLQSAVLFVLLILSTTLASAPKPTTYKPITKHPSHPSPSPPPPPPPTALSTLITRTCAATSRPSLCSSSLQSSPEALSATEPAALCSILLSISAANASSAASSATALAANITSSSASSSTSGDARKKVVPLLKACAGRYGDAAAALREAEQSVQTEDFEYAYVHASAALEYPRMCRDMFDQNKAAYPLEMAKTEDRFVALCTVAVEIVAILGE